MNVINDVKNKDENELFIFELDKKNATIASELMYYIGYKNARKSWYKIKNREQLKKNIDYLTLKNNDLKLFKNFIKTIHIKSLVNNQKTIYNQYIKANTLDIVFLDSVKHIINIANTQNAIVRRYYLKRYEEETIPYIIESFKDVYNPIYQYKVGNYFIDLYIPELNLAIECDENGHRFYDKQKELEREQYIKNKLGCEFIRYNPNDKNFKVTDVVNEIIKYALKINYKNNKGEDKL